LAAHGIVDLKRVGYIGFSHSCWFGMEMLTNGSFALKASLIAVEKDSAIEMWQPYSVLRYLKKPVELELVHLDRSGGTKFLARLYMRVGWGED